jgi:hypothetical protein
VYRPRPLTIDVVAILNFVFGTSTILGSICGGGNILFMILMANSGMIPPMPGGQPNPAVAQADLYTNKIPGFIPFVTVSLTLSLIMGVVIIFAGVGLFRLKPWARRLCVIWCVYTIISVTVGTIYNLMLVNPAIEAWMHDYYAQMGMANMEQPNWNGYFTILAGLVGMAYAIAIPTFLYRRSVSEALAGKWVPPWLRDQNDDEEEASGGEGESPEDSPTTATQGIRPVQE